MTNIRNAKEDRATQLLIWETLSLAKKSHSLLNIDQRESELIASHLYEPSGYLVTRSIDFMAKEKLGTSQ